MENTQINKNRNKRGKIISNAEEIKIIIRRYYKQLFARKLEKLEEMYKFLQTYHLPRLNPWINPHTEKTLRPDGFTGEFYQAFRLNTNVLQTLL